MDGLGLERDAGELPFAVDAPVVVGVATLTLLEDAIVVCEQRLQQPRFGRFVAVDLQDRVVKQWYAHS